MTGKLVDLRTRTGYRPDPGALAREQLTQARRTLGLEPDEFAELLAPVLGWEPPPDMIVSWETSVVPPGDVLVAAGLATHSMPRMPDQHGSVIDQMIASRFADVIAVYPTRSEFMSQLPPQQLLDGAAQVWAAGLSLNLLCQQFGDRRLTDLVDSGATLRCLFLDPGGTSVRQREAEEGYPQGHLSALTEMNIQLVLRIRSRLLDDARGRLEVATIDDTIRFNLMLVDAEVCVAQPYLPEARGVDSPTLVIQRRGPAGLFPTFAQIFTALWERGRPL